jgi:hypothetical protein
MAIRGGNRTWQPAELSSLKRGQTLLASRTRRK